MQPHELEQLVQKGGLRNYKFLVGDPEYFKERLGIEARQDIGMLSVTGIQVTKSSLVPKDEAWVMDKDTGMIVKRYKF